MYNNYILASDVDHIIISEIQISGDGVYDEFVELYNPIDQEIDLENWDLKRKTKSGIENNVLNNIEGIIPAYGYFLIIPRANCGDGGNEDCYKGAVVFDDEYTTNSFFAKDNTILLYNNNGVLIDKLGWGSAVDFESEVVMNNPENDQSLERTIINGIVKDTDNNSADFVLQTVPNPQNSSVVNDQNSENEQEENGNSSKTHPNPSQEGNRIIITEFLPNPKGSDSEDEFIEIYNSGNIEIDLENWTLEDKMGSIKKFIIPEGTKIGADEYRVFYSSETKITLNNNGDGVLLRNSEDNVISETSLSNLAPEGQSYSLNKSGNWIWTLMITPEKENVIMQEDQQDDNSSQEDEINDSEQDDSGETHLNPSGEGNKIIITEFLSNPEDSDRDNEFIEIYNNDTIKIDLEGWALEDKMGSVKKFIIPEGTKIDVGKYKVFYSDQTRITLNNSGDGVILRDNKNNIIDETPVSGLVKEDQSFAKDKNESWVLTLRPTPGRKNVIRSEENDKQKSSTQENGVGGIDNKINSTNNKDSGADDVVSDSYDYSDRIVISEIYPNPIGNDNREENYEWIEIYNNSDSKVNLKGWRIDDILNKGSKPYLIIEDIIIKPRDFVVFQNSQTKIVLNNSGDEVNILWPDGTVVDNLKYEKSKEGYSYNWVSSDSWDWNKKITPGNNNIVENNNVLQNGEVKGAQERSDDINDNNKLDYVKTNISEVKSFDKYTRVKISGVVSTPVGIFSDRSFYLSGSGIQVHSYEIISKKFSIGDEIELIGRLSEIGGEKRILIDGTGYITILSRDNLVKPKLIFQSDLTDELVGSLIIIEGKVFEISKNLFYIGDENGKVKIYIKPDTGIIISDIKKNNWVTITGQVSKTSLGYRVLPRFQNDIKLAKTFGTSTFSETLFQSNKNVASILKNTTDARSLWNILFFLIIAMILFDWGRMRIKNR
ncbi:MAG: lamin tail domain-containing protein [Candidatus Pacebacteria bacterium]|nr:lamin tail domain-containing protein [Candidatus Paceibacterota bacterium]